MLDDISDSFLLHATNGGSDSIQSAFNIADLILDGSPEKKLATAPNVLSQIVCEDAPVVAGQIETSDGNLLPITIGQTDIGNGKPTPYIHISDDPSVLSRHITITTVQTNDGKFRALLRVNHPHGRVLLGGSVIRPETMYPIMDDDEIIIGDGVRFKLRLNNQSPQGRQRNSIGAPTPYYVPAPNSEEMHETEEREKEEKRRQFQERLTPPNDEAFLLQLATAGDSDPQISVVHQMGDTCPYSSGRESTSQVPGAPVESIICDFMPTDEVEDDQIESPPVEDSAIESGPEDEMIESPQLPEEPATDPERSIGSPSMEEHEPNEMISQQHAVVTEEPGPQDDFIETSSDKMEESGTPVQTEPSSQAMSEGTEPPPEQGRIATSAPQLSQEVEDSHPSLMERVRSKRHLEDVTNVTNDSFSQPKRKTQKPTHIDTNETRTRRSGRNSVISPAGCFDGGPKKLVLLKTAVDIDKATESAVSSVGAKIESKWTDKIDGLVTGSIVRTTKFLCAINRGLAIFPKSILNDIKTYRALPPTDRPELWLSDPEGERKYDFVLADSIQEARKRPLLEGYDVYCFKNNIGEFSGDELKDLVTTAGGKLLARLPKQVGGKVILIGAESNAGTAKSSGASFLNKIEFLVDACIKQKLDFEFGKINIE